MREPGKLLSRWNLVVPERVLNRPRDAEPVVGPPTSSLRFSPQSPRLSWLLAITQRLGYLNPCLRCCVRTASESCCMGHLGNIPHRTPTSNTASPGSSSFGWLPKISPPRVWAVYNMKDRDVLRAYRLQAWRVIHD
jgi:hypothetical protein